jgi:hypothetical protein
MYWSSLIKRQGTVEQANSGIVEDPFWFLACQAKVAGVPLATVESKVSHWGQHVSVSFSVSLQCPQAQGQIEEAARLAYVTATRFVNDAVSRLDSGMPMLPTG